MAETLPRLTGDTQNRADITAADTVILYRPWWNPAVEQQDIDRANRIGQDKPVFVYKLLASGTVEDKMLELQAGKAGLLLSGVASDAALNAEDFEQLFRPVGEGQGALGAVHIVVDARRAVGAPASSEIGDHAVHRSR